MTMKLFLPWPAGDGITTQTFSQHVQRAKSQGLCSAPGPNCPNGYYYGGYDRGLPMRTPLYSAIDSRVIFSGWDKPNDHTRGYGLHIKTETTLEDGSKLVCVYGHLDELYKRVGDTLTAGSPIGLSGSTGFSTGPHLHFETRRNGIPFDPAPYFTETPPVPPTPPVEPPVKPPVSMPTFPELPLVNLLTSISLNIRSGPSRTAKIVGTIPAGTESIPVLYVIVSGDNIIACIGWNQFIFLQIEGKGWYEWATEDQK